jgi:hypothetical protein
MHLTSGSLPLTTLEHSRQAERRDRHQRNRGDRQSIDQPQPFRLLACPGCRPESKR